MPPPKSSVT